MEDLFVERAEQRGWLVRKVQWLGRRRAPDRFLARGGRVMLVELKQPGEPARVDQAREIAALRAAGVEVHLIDNLRDGYALLD